MGTVRVGKSKDFTHPVNEGGGIDLFGSTR